MPLELNRYPGNRIRLTFKNGVVTPWITLNVTHRVEFEECKGSGSGVQQRVVIHEDAEGDLEFYNSADLNSANLQANTPVEQLELASNESGNPSLLPENFFVKFPVDTWLIGELGVKQDDKSGRVTVKFSPNVLDIAA